MTQTSLLSPDLQQELRKCAKCGQCRSVCPVFIETGNEALVTRGKLSLIEALLDDQIAATGAFYRAVDTCLKCLRCASQCPSGVDTLKIIRAAQQALRPQRASYRLAKIFLRTVLPRRRWYNAALRLAALNQKVIRSPDKSSQRLRHLPLILLEATKLPPLASAPVLSREFMKKVSFPPPSPRRGKVVLFVGCLINYVYPPIAVAAVKVLHHLGFEVIIPPEQVCCGMPALALGDDKAALNLARINQRVLLEPTDIDAVVTACASCGRMLKHEYEQFVNNSELSAKCCDIAEFIANQPAELLPAQSEEDEASLTVYHDPCHLRFGQGIAAEPRQLLTRQANFREMPEADKCCGLGGVFSLLYPEISASIGARKVKHIQESRTDQVATGCPGCIMQLRRLTKEAGLSCQVSHTVEILAASLPDYNQL